MFCTNCGKEVNDTALFCPYCGMSFQESPGTAVKENTNKGLSGKAKKLLIVLVIIIIGIFATLSMARKAELSAVRLIADNYMNTIKTGLDEETMDKLVDEMIYASVSNETIASYLTSNINGEDVLDIYAVVMRYMDYSITNVDKVEPGYYQVTIQVTNLNNKIVATETAKYFIERYTGGGKLGAIIQLIEDLSSDKSQTIASLYGEVADYYYSQNSEQYFLTGEYVIDVEKVDDKWVPSCDQGLDTFVMNCAGISTY